MSEKKSKKTRPKYTPEKKDEILRLAEDGKTNAQIAAKLGLAVETIEKWTSQKEDLIRAIKEAKEPTDNTVEATLLQKALGYHKETVKVFFDSKTGQVIEHRYIDFVEPDTASAIFWLRNRQPDRWRESRNIQIEDTTKAQEIAAMTEVGSKIIEALEKWNK